MMSTLDKVHRLVRYATGEECGDGSLITDVVVGYAEPGYGSNDTVVVFGNWNDRGDDTLPSRLARSLERVGAEIEWLDEWTQCQGCWRAIRTEPDSYHWQPAYVWVDDTGPLCRDCLLRDGADALDYCGHIGTADTGPAKGVTWCDAAHLESFGFVKWEPGDPHTYEQGWHPGQDDEPEPIFAEIIARHPDAEVIFFLDENSQFYFRFSAYVRLPGGES